MSWSLNRFLGRLPNRTFGKTHKDNRLARLVDLNKLVDEANDIFTQIEDAVTAGFCDITMQPPTVTEGTTVSVNIDGLGITLIPGVAELAFNGSNFFNPVEEGFADFAGGSPSGLEFNSNHTDPSSFGFTDISDVTTRTYGTLYEAFNSDFSTWSAERIGKELIMRHPATGTYWKFKMTALVAGRTSTIDVEITELNIDNCKITFSDGTTMETAPVIPVDTNTSELTNTAFIDPVNGDNSTAVIGDSNKPFQTIAGAGSIGIDMIYLMPGNYTETVNLISNMIYYAAPGVVFTSGGIRTVASTLSDTKWLGHAVFDGNFAPFYITGQPQLINFVFEFDRINCTSTGVGAFFLWTDINNPSNVTVRGNSIKGVGGGSYEVSLIGYTNGSITISEEISSPYQPIFLGFNAAYPVRGTLEFNCPKVVLEDGGYVGNNAAYKRGITVLTSDPLMDYTFNVNIYSEVTTPLAATTGAIGVYSTGSGGKITWNGYADATNLLHGIYNAINSNSIVARGDISVPNGKLFANAGSGSLSLEDGKSEESVDSTVGGTGTVYLKNYHIHAKGAGQDIITISTATGLLYCDNVIAEGDGGAGLFINTSGNAWSAGLKDTWSTQANDAAFTNLYAAGFTQEVNVIANKIF